MLVLACLSGSKAADTLRDAGIRFGARAVQQITAGRTSHPLADTNLSPGYNRDTKF
jgi:hypothetical protein